MALWLRLHGKHVCEEKGCNKEAMQCHLVDYGAFWIYSNIWFKTEEKDIIYWYCTEHTTKNGFCWMCGEFWAGNSEFDFNNSHLCPNCRDGVDAETVQVNPEEAGWFE